MFNFKTKKIWSKVGDGNFEEKEEKVPMNETDMIDQMYEEVRDKEVEEEDGKEYSSSEKMTKMYDRMKSLEDACAAKDEEIAAYKEKYEKEEESENEEDKSEDMKMTDENIAELEKGIAKMPKGDAKDAASKILLSMRGITKDSKFQEIIKNKEVTKTTDEKTVVMSHTDYDKMLGGK
jgi:hypothetical protein